jgi:hypothetical protein
MAEVLICSRPYSDDISITVGPERTPPPPMSIGDPVVVPLEPKAVPTSLQPRAIDRRHRRGHHRFAPADVHVQCRDAGADAGPTTVARIGADEAELASASADVEHRLCACF